MKLTKTEREKIKNIFGGKCTYCGKDIAVFKFYCLNRQYYGVIKNDFKIYIRKSPLRIKKLIDCDDVFFKEIIKL